MIKATKLGRREQVLRRTRALSRLISTILTVRLAALLAAVNFNDLQRARFGMRLAFFMYGRKTPC